MEINLLDDISKIIRTMYKLKKHKKHKKHQKQKKLRVNYLIQM